MGTLFVGTRIDRLFKTLRDTGIDPIEADYILVVGTDDELYSVESPVQIIRDPQANGSAYLVRRKDYYREEIQYMQTIPPITFIGEDNDQIQ